MFSTLRHTGHLARAAVILARHDALWPAEFAQKPVWLGVAGSIARHVPLGGRMAAGEGMAAPERLARALEALGPAYIKLGQLLATRPDVVGPRVAGALASLQDRLPAFPQAEAEAVIAEAFGKPVSALYESLGPALAAASIAQVHKGTVAGWIGHNLAPANDTGENRSVAVKILRPGVERAFRKDLDSLFWAARLVERHVPRSRRLEPVKLVETLAASVALELDLRLEAAAAAEMAKNIAQDTGFRVPKIDWSHTARRVLTLEWIDGIPIGDREALAAAGHNLPGLATRVMQSFLTHALRDGFFHADMHPGNLFVDAQGRIVAVDFGIMGRLDALSRRYLAEILMGFLTRDYARVAQVHVEAGYVPAQHGADAFAQALRAIGEPIFGRSAGEISMARLFTQLFETTALFDMHLRPELVLLQKTMVAVEGVARNLDPEHNLWDAARPVVERFMARELGPEARLQEAAEGAAELGKVVAGLPGFLKTVERAAALYAERGLRLDPASVEAMAEARARSSRAEKLAWAAVGVALALAAVMVFGG